MQPPVCAASCQGRRQRGVGGWCPAPPFHVWPIGCCIHPILYFKNVPPLLVFGPPAATSWRRSCLMADAREAIFRFGNFQLFLQYFLSGSPPHTKQQTHEQQLSDLFASVTPRKCAQTLHEG